MRKQLIMVAAGLAITSLLPSQAMAQTADEIAEIRAEVQRLRESYEREVSRLESKITNLEARLKASETLAAAERAATTRQAEARQPSEPGGQTTSGGRGPVTGNAFNPSIGIIFNGRFASFSENPDDFRLSGFPLGGETGPGPESFALDETELNFSANVNDLFYASTTAALDAGDDGVEIDLEEAYIQTLTLPYGMTAKAGRFFAALGYLNENHTHTDNFADRPLPYQAFLADQFNDEGVQLAIVLPTDIYAQVGGGIFRGADFPAGGSPRNGVGAYTGFLRLGGDIGFSNTWRLGLSFLHTDSAGRLTGGEDAAPADLLNFVGNTDLVIGDFKYVWSPNGNAVERYFSLQGEYMFRDQEGSYNDIAYDGNDSGWYLEGMYKFRRGWRLGYRYSRLNPENNIPIGLRGSALDSFSFSPRSHSVALDWSRNEFSTIRLQYSRDRSRPIIDDRFYIQYIMSIGAHAAHNF